MTNTELIQKIRAEIERRIKLYSITNEKEQWIVNTYWSVLSFLDTLQEPEVDLDDEIERRYDQAKWGYVDGFGSVCMDKGQFTRIARHFAQWGAEHLKK